MSEQTPEPSATPSANPAAQRQRASQLAQALRHELQKALIGQVGVIDELRAKYPTLLKEIRGRGLMIGVEFQDISETMPFGVKHMVALLDDKLKGSLCGFVGALLLKEHDVLVAFTEYNRNVIRLEPPLIVTREQCDQFIAALDDVLSRGVTGIVTGYLRKVAAAKC